MLKHFSDCTAACRVFLILSTGGSGHTTARPPRPLELGSWAACHVHRLGSAHRRQQDPFLSPSPPEPASRPAAVSARSAFALAPHKHAAATAHVTFARPRDARNKGEPWGSRHQRTAWATSPCCSAVLPRDSRRPGWPCLAPHRPCACPSTYLGGLSCPTSCEGSSLVPAQRPLPVSGRARSLPAAGRVQPHGGGTRRSAPRAGVPAPPRSSQPSHEGQVLLFGSRHTATASKSQEMGPGALEAILAAQVAGPSPSPTPARGPAALLPGTSGWEQMCSGTATEAGTSSRQEGKMRLVLPRDCYLFAAARKDDPFQATGARGWAGTAEDGRDQPAQPGLRQQNPRYGNKPLRAACLGPVRCQGASTQAAEEGQIVGRR